MSMRKREEGHDHYSKLEVFERETPSPSQIILEGNQSYTSHIWQRMI